MPILSPWARQGMKYLGAPLAVGAMAASATAPEAGDQQYESDRNKYDRIELAHMAGGGALGGLLGLAANKYLAPGKIKYFTPLIGAAIGAGAAAEYTAPWHYAQQWKTRKARNQNYPSAASARAGVPYNVNPEDYQMDPGEMRRRQLLGF